MAISSIIILLTAACASYSADNEKLVEQIEQSIKLPEGALEIQFYARYYARKGDIVYAAYIIHADSTRAREAVKDECERFGIKSYPCNDRNYGVIEAGKYAWVGKREDFPISTDAGCDEVDIEYDVGRKSFSRIECSGRY